MESVGFNGTLIAQLFNFLILILFAVVIGVLIVRFFSRRPPSNRCEEDVREINRRLGEIETKLDDLQKNKRV